MNNFIRLTSAFKVGLIHRVNLDHIIRYYPTDPTLDQFERGSRTTLIIFDGSGSDYLYVTERPETVDALVGVR